MRERSQFTFVRSLARHAEMSLRYPLEQVRERGDDLVVSLVALEAAHRDDQA